MTVPHWVLIASGILHVIEVVLICWAFARAGDNDYMLGVHQGALDVLIGKQED